MDLHHIRMCQSKSFEGFLDDIVDVIDQLLHRASLHQNRAVMLWDYGATTFATRLAQRRLAAPYGRMPARSSM